MSKAHHCEWQSMGTHCGNGWMGALKVLYLKLKAKAALKFNTFSQAKLELKAKAALQFNTSSQVKLLNY